MSANVCFAPQRYSFLLNISTTPPEILINDKKIIIIAIVLSILTKMIYCYHKNLLLALRLEKSKEILFSPITLALNTVLRNKLPTLLRRQLLATRNSLGSLRSPHLLLSPKSHELFGGPERGTSKT